MDANQTHTWKALCTVYWCQVSRSFGSVFDTYKQFYEVCKNSLACKEKEHKSLAYLYNCKLAVVCAIAAIMQ